MTRLRPHILSPSALIPLAGILFCLAAASPSAAAQGQTESACVSCHRARSESQPRTRHGSRARVSRRQSCTQRQSHTHGAQRPLYLDCRKTRSAESTYIVSDGTRTISIPIHWNFGAGAQTWVLDYNGHRYESAVSFYPSIPGLDFTTGDEDLKPKNLEEAIGREIELRETKVCFGCHASNAVTNGKMTYETLRTGVTCEHCHPAQRFT